MHVGVEDFGPEANERRHERVLLWDCDRQLKDALFIGCILRALESLKPKDS